MNPTREMKAVREKMKTNQDDCTHWELKVRKHRGEVYPCLHCLGCGATWSDPVRAMEHLRKAKKIVFWSKYE